MFGFCVSLQKQRQRIKWRSQGKWAQRKKEVEKEAYRSDSWKGAKRRPSKQGHSRKSSRTRRIRNIPLILTQKF